jgi:hypothetical protein
VTNRRNSIRIRVLAVSSPAIALVMAANVGAAIQYNVMNLGTLGGTTSTASRSRTAA